MDNIINLRKRMKRKLDPMRYEHTLSVSFTCMALAMRYGYDLEKAELAGLLHDCAKHFTDEELILRCEKHGVLLDPADRMAPAVIHAKYGAWLAAHKYQISDEEILEAIRCHTTGKPDMGMLDKILYIADFIEPRRNKAENLPQMRALAFEDLDRTMYEILKGTLGYLKKKNSFINPMTEQAYAWYEARMAERTAENEQEDTKGQELAAGIRETTAAGSPRAGYGKGEYRYGTGQRDGKAGYQRPAREKRRGRSGH